MRAPGLIVRAPKPAPKPPTFFKQPLKAPDFSTPLKQAQHQQRVAANKAPGRVLKDFPTLRSYTPQQRQHIINTNLPRLQRHITPTDRQSPNALASATNRLNAADRKQAGLLKRVVLEHSLAQDAQRFRDMTGATTADGPAQAHVFRDFEASQPHEQAKSLPKPQHMKFGGTTHILGLSLPGVHQGFYFADQALSNLARPAEAVAGAAYAAHAGKPILKGLADSFLQKKGETHTFSDVLGQEGLHGIAGTLAGAAGDVGLDPLNFVGGAVKAPADAAIETAKALSHLAQDLHAAGRVAEATKLSAKADQIAQHAATLPVNRGLSLRLGLGGKALHTSAVASAKVSKGLGLHALSNAVRENKGFDALASSVNPALKPLGVSSHDWQAFRSERVGARAAAASGERVVEDRMRAYGRVIRKAAHQAGMKPSEAYQAIVNALERASKDPLGSKLAGEHSILRLPQPLNEPARLMRKDFKAFGQHEYDAGVLGTINKNYVPHQLTKDAQKQLDKEGSGSLGRSNPYAKARADSRPIADIHAERANAGLGPIFDTNLPKLFGNRGAKSAGVIANRRFAENVVSRVGRPFSKLEQVGPHESVFKLGHPTADNSFGFTHVGNDEKSVASALAARKEGERLVVLPKEIGKGVQRGALERPKRDERGLLKNLVDRPTGAFKSAATVFNVPAYELRNMTGDVFKSSTGMHNLGEATGLVAKRSRRNMSAAHNLTDSYVPGGTVKIHHGIQVPADEFIKEAEAHGVIGSGHYGHELDYQLRDEGKAKAQLGRNLSPRHLTEGLRRFGANREDVARLASYVTLRRRGLAPEQAAKEVAHHIIDYADMTPFEQSFAKRVIPFYTFAARNASRMPAHILRNPGRYAGYGLLQEGGRKQAGLPADWQSKLPDYYRNQLPIPFKIKGRQEMGFPGSPITDLHRVLSLTDPVEELRYTLQGLNPMAKVPLEYATNNSMFFRQPIYQENSRSAAEAPHYVPAPWYVTHMPEPLRVQLAGGNKDAADKGFWTSKADYFARQLPQQNTITQVATSKTGSRNQNQLEAIASQLSGIKFNPYDKKKFATNAHFDQLNALDSKMADMRKLGLKGTPKYKQLQRQYYGLLYAKSKKPKKTAGVGTGVGVGVGTGVGVGVGVK